MLYFHLAPSKYRKILFVHKSLRGKESLAEYYIRCNGHLIPLSVEIWEYDPIKELAIQISTSTK